MNEPAGMGAAAWEAQSQAALDAIRANGDTKVVLVPNLAGYGLQTTWSNVHPKAWIADPAENHRYEAHFYFDRNGSGAGCVTAPESVEGLFAPDGMGGVAASEGESSVGAPEAAVGEVPGAASGEGPAPHAAPTRQRKRHEEEIAVEFPDQALPHARHRSHGAPLERAHRRIERAHEKRARDAHATDRPAADLAAERGDVELDVGKFRHAM